MRLHWRVVTDRELYPLASAVDPEEGDRALALDISSPGKADAEVRRALDTANQQQKVALQSSPVKPQGPNYRADGRSPGTPSARLRLATADLRAALGASDGSREQPRPTSGHRVNSGKLPIAAVKIPGTSEAPGPFRLLIPGQSELRRLGCSAHDGIRFLGKTRRERQLCRSGRLRCSKCGVHVSPCLLESLSLCIQLKQAAQLVFAYRRVAMRFFQVVGGLSEGRADLLRLLLGCTDQESNASFVLE